jgi:hypothetical protein
LQEKPEQEKPGQEKPEQEKPEQEKADFRFCSKARPGRGVIERGGFGSNAAGAGLSAPRIRSRTT